MPSGGLRPNAPQNKFGVSGTGGNGSKDGQPLRASSGGKYGERKASLDQQRSAPMVSAPTQPQVSVPQSSQSTITSLSAPTERPFEPVTSGMDFGAGAGSEALNLPKDRSLTEILSSLVQLDNTGDVQELLRFVTSRGL